MLRPCLDCGRPSPRSRCRECERGRQSVRNARRIQYHGTWKATRAKVLRAWRGMYGDWCPGWPGLPPSHPGIPPHPSADLTVDHAPDGSVSGVMCRSCNASKGRAAPVFHRSA